MMPGGRVLVLCTGGTIGMIPKNPRDPGSPLVAAPWERLRTLLPAFDRLPVTADFEPVNPVDSSDMTPGHWIRLAERIAEEYRSYDGFAILHGTDTMAYTASALSFMMERLAKPVVLTGAQRPLRTPKGDAERHLVGALRVAAHRPAVPEVCIVFGGRLIRGNRARKAFSPCAFVSPGYPELGRIGTSLRINAAALRTVRAQDAKGNVRLHTRVERNVLALPLHPGISPAYLRHVLRTKTLRGVILLTFGAGNAPSHPGIQNALAEAVRNGIAVVNVTQCFGGRVDMGIYETGAQLRELGLIDGGDMTPEAALTKLQIVLGMTEDANEIRARMQCDWAGERTPRPGDRRVPSRPATR